MKLLPPMNLCISCWNSLDPSVVNAVLSGNFSEIFISPSTDEAVSFLQKWPQINLFSTEQPLYYPDDSSLSTTYKSVGASLPFSTNFFNSDVTAILQTERLIRLNESTLIARYNNLLDVYWYWLGFILENNIDVLLFPLVPHTASDYLLLPPLLSLTKISLALSIVVTILLFRG